MSETYKAVFFDLDGTLYITTPSATDAFIQFARTLDIAIDAATEQKVKLWAHHYWSQHEQIRRDMEQLDRNGFWSYYSHLLLRAVGATDNLAENSDILRDYFFNDYAPQVGLPPTGRETLLALKAHGFTLGLISNRSNPLQEAVSRLGLDGIFDVVLSAGEIGHWKPNPAIFHHVLADFADLAPAECVYVGDNYYADGHGAAAAGLVPVLYDPEHLYRDPAYKCIAQMDELLAFLNVPQPSQAP